MRDLIFYISLAFNALFGFCFLVGHENNKAFDTANNSAVFDKRKVEYNKNVLVHGSKHWIDGVPMIEQGNSPTCIPVSINRVMNYIEGASNYDLQLIIGLCKTGQDGTSVDNGVSAYRRLLTSHGFGAKVIAVPRNQLADWVEDRWYWRTHVCANCVYEKVTFDMLKRFVQSVYDIDTVYGQIKTEIDKGQPVLWGFYPDYLKGKNPNGKEFISHCAIIIGYNDETKSIIYTDHNNESKQIEVPFVDALAVTTNFVMLTKLSTEQSQNNSKKYKF